MLQYMMSLKVPRKADQKQPLKNGMKEAEIDSSQSLDNQQDFGKQLCFPRGF